ncbi:hypothetical protein EH196_00430 [Bacillus sp. C1-1]|nr:hypothetical protein EH196_00430 [Bacillus sp. C1-1]
MRPKEDFEKMLFHLLEELYHLNSYHLLYKYLYEKTSDHDDLSTMNKIPSFFQLSMGAFQYSSIMGLAKLYEPSSRKTVNLNKFLNIVEGFHTEIFSNDPDIKKRLGRTTNVNSDTVRKHKNELNEQEKIIKRLLAWRDKFFAHNDKKYFYNKNVVSKEFPINFYEYEQLITLAADILNTYSIGYSGKYHDIKACNIYDVDILFKALKKN